MNKISYCLVGLLCTLSGQVSAANIQSELLNCSKMSDSLKRLVCYDNVVQKMNGATVAVTKEVIQPATAPVKKQEAAMSAPIAKIISPPKSVPTTPAINVTKTASSSDERKPMDAVQHFGAERKYIKKEQVEEVRLTVKSVTKTVRGKLKVTFENGQIWQQKDTDKFAKYVAGDIAIIKRGVFDSFYMKKPDANRTIRVKRIK